jgi:hypothetical protein
LRFCGHPIIRLRERSQQNKVRRQDMPGRKTMIERIPELVNSDVNLVRRGRFLNTTFLMEIGDKGYLVRIVGGRVVSITPGPFITPNYRFALRAPREAWQTFWQRVPPPGFNDIFALFKRGLLRIEGDLHPFMSNLLYIKDVLAAPRKEAAR